MEIIKNKKKEKEKDSSLNTQKDKIILNKKIKRDNNISFDNNNEFKTNPKNIQFLNNLIETKDYDYFYSYYLENLFLIFKSINDILYLIYSNNDGSIISYDLKSFKKINEIKKAHNRKIINFRYYLDKENERDLIISISCEENNIKLWNIYNFECLFDFKNIYRGGIIYSACFLNDIGQIYIITSNFKILSEPIKVYDLKGNKIKEINNLKEDVFFIDSYYDNDLDKNYLIIGNKYHIISYDFKDNKIYHRYNDFDYKRHFSIIINNKIKVVELIESSYDGNIRIWDFHSGKLLRKIKVSKFFLFGTCLWSNEYIFVGCGDNTIILLDLKKEKIIKTFVCKNMICNIKKFIHPKYGECLIYLDKNIIKLLAINNKNY